MEHKKPWRTRIDRHTSPMDTDSFWQHLEGKLDTDRRRRGFFMLWFVLVVLCGTIMYFSGRDTIRKAVEDHPIATYPGTRAVGGRSGTEPSAIEADYTTGISPGVQGSRHKIGELDRPDVLNTPTGAINWPSSEISYTVAPATYPSPADVSAGAVQRSGDTAVIAIAVTEPGHLQEHIPAQPLIAGDTPDEEGLTEQGRDIGYTGERSQGDTARALSGLPDGPAAPDHHAGASIKAGPDDAPRRASQDIRRPVRTWRLWTDLSYGAGYAFHRFDTRDAQYIPYLSLRREFETPLESHMASWEGRLIHPSGFYLLSGLRYQAHISRFDWRTEERLIAWGLADGFIPGGHGDPIPFQDSAWQHYDMTREIRQHDRVSSLAIPVSLGLVRQKKNWSVEIAAGIIAGFSHRSSGMSLGLDGSPVAWHERPELTYHNRVRIDATVMFRAGWYPVHSLGIFIQPVFTYSPSNRLIGEAGYTHRIHSVHLQLGLSFLLYESGK